MKFTTNRAKLSVDTGLSEWYLARHVLLATKAEMFANHFNWQDMARVYAKNARSNLVKYLESKDT